MRAIRRCCFPYWRRTGAREVSPLVIEEAYIAEFVEKLSAAARAYEVPTAA
jgi:DNA-dependent RNA polymerase auxiliary subunit epsilon